MGSSEFKVDLDVGYRQNALTCVRQEPSFLLRMLVDKKWASQICRLGIHDHRETCLVFYYPRILPRFILTPTGLYMPRLWRRWLAAGLLTFRPCDADRVIIDDADELYQLVSLQYQYGLQGLSNKRAQRNLSRAEKLASHFAIHDSQKPQ